MPDVQIGLRPLNNGDQAHPLLTPEGMGSALNKGEFQTVFQPIVSREGRIEGFEALLRWRHQNLDIGPDLFIPAAEENGLIVQLGVLALRSAALQLRRLEQVGVTHVYASVNVSPVQLSSDFKKAFLHVLGATGIAPQRIMLEITERKPLIPSPEALGTLLKSLVQTGAGLGLDDFGTSYSGLSYLKAFPFFSCLKLDRSYITHIESDEGARAILRGLVSMAQQLRLSLVAEGVESERQADVLMGMGVPLFQGFLFCKPMSAQEMLNVYGS